MRDVAERAGVSVRTVSNVVNDYHYVKPSTRERVQQALDDLGYEVNAAARNLKSGRTGMVALVVPELHSPYFAELADAVVRAARRRDLTVLVEVTEADRARELQVLTGSRRYLTDGTLFSPVRLGRDDLPGTRTSAPVVVLGESDLGERFDHVGVDNVDAVRAVVRHLLDTGRTRVAALGVDSSVRAGRLRLEAVETELASEGLAPHALLATTAWERSDGARAVEELLASTAPDDLPDAIVGFTDTLALGALKVLLRNGIDVPGQIAVTGVDDVDDAAYSTPDLTSLAPDLDALAESALGLLVEQLDLLRTGAPLPPPRNISTPFAVVVRGSTVAAADAT